MLELNSISSVNIGDTVFRILSPKEKGFVIDIKQQNYDLPREFRQNERYYVSILNDGTLLNQKIKEREMWHTSIFATKQNRISMVVHCKLLLLEKSSERK